MTHFCNVSSMFRKPRTNLLDTCKLRKIVVQYREREREREKTIK